MYIFAQRKNKKKIIKEFNIDIAYWNLRKVSLPLIVKTVNATN